jgi:tetratricopeptide (TPR) repeat protein
MNESEPAILSFTQALQIDSEFSEAYYNRARVNFENKNIDAALEDLSAVIDLKPFEARYFMERAQIYISLDDRAKALRDLERVLEVTQDEELTSSARNIIAAIH